MLRLLQLRADCLWREIKTPSFVLMNEHGDEGVSILFLPPTLAIY
jgi:hypothetical protein